MKKSKSLMLLLFAVFFIFRLSPSYAIAISFSPSSPTVHVGDSFDVDVVISGLSAAGEIVSAYDLDVSYDAALLSATGVQFGPWLDDLSLVAASFQAVDLTIPGLIDFAELALLSDAQLAAVQPDTFTLATLSFDALSVGNGPLFFIPDVSFGIDVKGRNAAILSPMNAGIGDITIAQARIAEPETLWLMLIAMMGLVLSSRHRIRSCFKIRQMAQYGVKNRFKMLTYSV